MDDNNLQQQPPAFNGNPSGLRRPQPPMDMVSAIKKALVTPTDFAGRSRRSEFWWFTLFYVAAAQLAAFLFNAFAGMTVSLGAQYAVMVALMLLSSIRTRYVVERLLSKPNDIPIPSLYQPLGIFMEL